MSRLIHALFLILCSAAPAVDFEQDIEPIFAENCADCHGEDTQKGQFRLDRLAVLLRGGDSGEPSVVPGDPEGSFLMKVIRHLEPDKEMPPKGDPLAAGDIALIEQWIKEGAETPESYGPAEEKVELTHWSFVPVKRPGTADTIDGFIRNTLQEKELGLSPEADRRTLIRRLHLVMTGLPPTPEQVDRFLADTRENAWQILFEEILASPHYGERMATFWLDLVRFGETNGFETNRERPNAWRYRDWVIDSFNRDKPYDQFVREQIAGDVLGEKVATGFLVAGPYDVVKGKDPKLGIMQRMNELDDIINTTGTAFLGLTTGCARCHNHKFDPISQKDYYAMQAIFAGVEHGETDLPKDPEIAKQLNDLDGKIAELTGHLEPFLSEEPIASTGPEGASTLRSPVDPVRNVEQLSPRPARFVRFTIDKSSSGQPCIDELEIYSGGKNIALASNGAKVTSSGDFEHPLHKLAHLNDGQYGNAKSWISAQAKGGWVQVELPGTFPIERIEWSRDREGKFRDRLATGYRIEVALEPEHWELVAHSGDRLPPGSKAVVRGRYDFSGHPEERIQEGKAWEQTLLSLRTRREELAKPVLAYAGKFNKPGTVYRLYRGEPDLKREEVGPDAIEVFTSLKLAPDAPEPERRRAFAEWVANPDNPLTARVIANRLWQFHFGTGIVDTPSDLGKNGTAPTHPELLDWLASELIESGWSLKHLHRLILTSATWRQENKPRPDAMEIDAASRMLWRFPPRRLEAEGIRDAILAASGKLDSGARGGPGFSAFEVVAENVRHYHPRKAYGPEDWRRMIYMTKVRQEKDHVFGAFDCPDASQAVPKRSRSTTPLQALNLLNSGFVMEQAGFFAQRLEREAASTEDRVRRAFALCFQRNAGPEDIADAKSFIEQEGLVQFARVMLNANEFVFIP